MRGADKRPGSMFNYVSLEARVPADHPLRALRQITGLALGRVGPQLDELYVRWGRPSIPPKRLLHALLLQALFIIRSERQLMEQLDYNLLFRWFVGLRIDDAVWAPTTFTKNRDRLLDGDIAAAFFEAVLVHADTVRLLADDHFTVDGTLLEAWASHKNFRPRDEEPPTPDGGGNPTVNVHGQRRSNTTHVSTTDPDVAAQMRPRKSGPAPTRATVWSPLRLLFLFPLLRLLSLPLAIGLPLDRNDLGVVHEAVDERDGAGARSAPDPSSCPPAVWRARRRAGKSDPSRGRGTRAGGRDDRGGLQDCDDGGDARRRLRRTGPPADTPASSTRGHDHTTRRWRRGDCSGDRLSAKRRVHDVEAAAGFDWTPLLNRVTTADD